MNINCEFTLVVESIKRLKLQIIDYVLYLSLVDCVMFCLVLLLIQLASDIHIILMRNTAWSGVVML